MRERERERQTDKERQKEGKREGEREGDEDRGRKICVFVCVVSHTYRLLYIFEILCSSVGI